MSLPAIRGLFWISGLYDFIIGLTFLFFGATLYEKAGIPAPNHWGYVQFTALLLMIFGCMFFAIARNPVANRNLIPFGILLKISYVGIVSFYWATGGVPMLFKPFVVIDAIMLVLFLLALGGA